MVKVTVLKVLKPIITLILVVLVVVSFLHYFTLSDNNKLAWQSSWFHGDKNITSCPLGLPGLNASGICNLGVNYSTLGFPIQIPEEAISGQFWLAWTINICVVVLLATGLIYIIIRKFTYGVLVSLGLLILIVTIPYLSN